MKTSLTYRREVADKMLKYLKKHKIQTCDDSHNMLEKISDVINEPTYNLWKAYQLLRIMARIELNCPNGQKGFKVLDYSLLASNLSDRPKFVCDIKICPIIKVIKKKFPDIFKE